MDHQKINHISNKIQQYEKILAGAKVGNALQVQLVIPGDMCNYSKAILDSLASEKAREAIIEYIGAQIVKLEAELRSVTCS